jgi:small redox-active disulfide protein 2
MAEGSVQRIKIAGFPVGIVGLEPVMAGMAESCADKTDAEIGAIMLERLGGLNHIPAPAREDYGKAFVREFRKFLGQPYTEEPSAGPDIKVLGAGCAQCNHLVEVVMDVLSELKIPASVDHVTDFKEIAKYGVMGVPALLINAKVVAVGSVPPREKIKKWLLDPVRGFAKK